MPVSARVMRPEGTAGPPIEWSANGRRHVAMDRFGTAVRAQVALGRLLPLGGPDDPLWITESAAVRVLRQAGARQGTRLGRVRIRLAESLDPHGEEPPAGPLSQPADGDTGGPSGVVPHRLPDEPGDRPSGVAQDRRPDDPSDGTADWVTGRVTDRATAGDRGVPDAAPLGALPHGPLRIEADVEVTADEPLPLVAERLRDALWAQAQDRLGVVVEAVDLRITGILEGPPDDPEPHEDGDPAEPEPAIGEGPAGSVAAAVRAVPGVRALTQRLAGSGPGVRVADPEALPGSRRVQVQIAVAPGHPPVGVARAAAAAATAAATPGAPAPVSTAVVVTDVHGD
ncbi:hypothetical protein [Streptomyces sp. NPDC020917]|uniref:hypothetical protein n=1 Tax=Streptomyces sp. NPDC020917 TaxID=3365102 RepID=UPI00379DEBAC